MADGVGRRHDAAEARPRAAGHRRARRSHADPPGDRGVQAGDRLQSDGGVRRHRRLRPERRQLSRAAARAVHRLQSARADAVARQGAGAQAARVSPHPVAGFHRRAAQSQAGAAQEARVSADRQVADLRVVDRHLAGVGRGQRGAAAEAREVHPRHDPHAGDRRAVHRRPRAVRRRDGQSSPARVSGVGDVVCQDGRTTTGASPPSA